MTIYYAIVDGDPISSGGSVHVFENDERIEGPDGRTRAVAYLGDKAWCEACQTWGVIVSHSGVSDYLRTNHYKRGKQAVSGDGVVCKCASMPLLLAVYGRRESIHDTADAARVTNKSQAPSLDTYDEQFTLKDAAGYALANVGYRIVLGGGRVFNGTTNAAGQTQRVLAQESSSLKLQLEKQ